MSLFSRRDKTASGLPPELQAYTQAERRERIGVAWLVGIVSLLVSVVVIFLLFLGGRWVYRKFAHRESRPTPVVVDQTQKDQNKNEAKDTEQSDTTNTTPSGSGNSGSQNTPTQPTTGTQTPSSSLPNTGPDIDL